GQRLPGMLAATLLLARRCCKIRQQPADLALPLRLPSRLSQSVGLLGRIARLWQPAQVRLDAGEAAERGADPGHPTVLPAVRENLREQRERLLVLAEDRRERAAGDQRPRT